MLQLLSARRVGFALVLAVSAYAWWVGAQYGRLNALNQLEVQDASAELKRVVENAVGTISTLKLPGAVEGVTAPGKAPGCVFDEQQPYLDFLSGDDCKKAFHYQNVRLVTSNGLLIQAEPAGPDDLTPEERSKAQVQWRVRLDTLFAELAFSDAFELIFVADENGQVLYQATPQHRDWRPLLRWGERTFEDSGAREAGGLRLQNTKSLFVKDAVPDWTRLHAVSDRTSVSLAGQSHQLYVEPVTGRNGINAQLVLGALVPTQGILRRALAVDTFAVALLVVVFLLALLGLPFLKLAAMSAHERLRTRDVYALYVSCAALVMLCTFIVVGYDTHLRWTREADEGLDRFADDLTARVDAEVRAIRDELVRYDTAVSKGSTSPCNSTKVIPSWLDVDPASDPTGLIRHRDNSVFIDQVSWIDPQGQQLWKFTSDREGVAVLRPVPQRPYFKAVRAGHLYRDAHSPVSFFVAPDRSITDGRFYTFLSIHSVLDTACASAAGREGTAKKAVSTTGYVAVASTRLLSLEQPSLPLGYGFAIVTRDGRTLYHSDPRLGLREDLFDHLDEQDLARAIVQSGTTASLSARYRALPHHLRFVPLPWSLDTDEVDPSYIADGMPTDASAGLTVVVFRDLSTEQAIVARVFVVGIGPMLLVLAAIGLGVWILGAVFERQQGGAMRWLWPHGGLAPMYKILAVSVAVILVVFFATTQLLTRAWPFLLLPACAVAPTFAVSRRGPWRTADRQALHCYWWYTTELTLLAFAMLIVPASAVANLTLGHEFGVLVQAEQKRMEAQSHDAELTLKDDARTLHYSENVGDEIAHAHEARQHQRLPEPSAARLRPTPFDARLDPVNSGDQDVIDVHDWLNDRLPAESALLARLRYHDVPSRYTPQGSLGSLSWFGAIGIVTVIVVLAAWVRWSARHLHAADITPGGAIADDQVVAGWAALSDDERNVLIQATEERIANPRQLPVVAELARKGFVKLSPDIQPSTETVALWLALVRADRDEAAKLQQWERTYDGHSWQAMRPIIFAALGLVAIFLAIAEPSLQSEVVGVTTSVAGLAGALMKLRDTVGGWFGKPVEAK